MDPTLTTPTTREAYPWYMALGPRTNHSALSFKNLRKAQ